MIALLLSGAVLSSVLLNRHKHSPILLDGGTQYDHTTRTTTSTTENSSGKQSLVKFSNANFPMTSDGRVYHLDLKAGEISNKIILVGDIERAKRYANLYLEKGYFTKESHRGYVCVCFFVDFFLFIVQ
jgi:hypothetical protein